MALLRSLTVAAAALLLTIPAAAVADHPVTHTKGAFDPEAVPKPVNDALGGNVFTLPGGGYRVDAKRGPDLYTHGPDPATSALSGGRAPASDPFGHKEASTQETRFGSTTQELAPECVGPSQEASQYYQRVLYAHPQGSPDDVDLYREDIREEIRQMNYVLDRDANASSGGRVDASYKVLCDSAGNVRVDSFSNPYATTFNGISSAARQAGFNRQNVDYTIFYDGNPTAGFCGVAGFSSSQTPSVNNPNNLGNAHAITFENCWDGSTAQHENGHNQGAVQYAAPHSTGTGAHCFDAYDVMCYNDGGDLDPGPPLVASDCTGPPPGDHRRFFDCGFNSYFDAEVESGEYLASNWNIGSSVNRFVDFDSGPPPANQPPQASFTHSCSDLDCSFTDHSGDDDGTIASRSWSFGDGSSSNLASPTHAYEDPGTYDVKLTVSDDDDAQATVTIPITVHGAESSVTELSNRITEMRNAGPVGRFDRYAFVVPRRRSRLSVSIAGDPCTYVEVEGVCRPDLDLYLLRGSQPELDSFTCRSLAEGISEKCVIKNPKRGSYGIAVHNYAADSGTDYTIRATHKR